MERIGQQWFAGLAGLAALSLLGGCASVPERELENAFRYQRLKHAETTALPAVDSELQRMADLAFAHPEGNGTLHHVALLESGDDALLARIHLIRSARTTIDIQTFIWKDDPTSRFVFDELVAAARRGVLVRMLIDALNTPGSPEQLARMARAHRNLEIALYKPMAESIVNGRLGFWDNLLFKARRMNRRMHNKLLLVDGRIGIAGGRNYEGKYYDRHPTFLFRDRDVLVAGPSVQDMEESFELFWQDKNSVFLTQFADVRKAFDRMDGDPLPFSDPADAAQFAEIDALADQPSLAAARPSIRFHEVASVRFVYDTPRKFKGREAMEFDDVFAELLEGAQSTLVYQTPYLIYNRAIRDAFKELKRRNPRFRIIASSNSLAAADHVHVYALSFKHRKELYKTSGIDIYEAKPHPADAGLFIPRLADTPANGEPPAPRLCIHAKSFVLDGRTVLVGSHNFDPRSAKLNTECGVFIEDEGLARELETRILKACEPQNAWTVSKAPTIPVVSRFSGFIGTISSALPFLDVWPYRYTTNYELKPGCEPLPPRDPEFHENYSDVGYFPQVPDSSTVIQTRLMKAFGGWARPFM